MTVGATLLALRRARGLSLTDIENMTGINKGALSKFERGIEGLGQQKLDKLCTLYGTTPSVIYAIARAATHNPKLLSEQEKLQSLVKNLSKLINRYLAASDSVRTDVEKLLSKTK
ncbi:MAG: helix-turn-helix domain-containing protein [Gammaproteobacteria bacterium]|nr:helix-turn-helix domain-containing protein [Gammaproteobacteria bacterium]MDH5801010.1 helix-turn-helix domain-containing protein [Gammaproteobacteria bacterium]